MATAGFPSDNEPTSSIDVLAAVPPLDKSILVLVSMWSCIDDSGGAVFDAVMASVFASIDFRSELIQKKRQQPFCLTLRNVAVEDIENGFVYKSFFRTDRRKANLEYIKKFVDSEAKEYTLGTQVGSFIKMKDVGNLILPDASVDAESFVQVARILKRAHNENVCHGDIRLANILLSESRCVLIDWDLSGEHGVANYPRGFEKIQDGERHPDVKNAIENDKIEKLKLLKEHDWFSLQKVMELFDPVNDLDVDTWKKLIGLEDIAKTVDSGEECMTAAFKVSLSDNSRFLLENLFSTAKM